MTFYILYRLVKDPEVNLSNHQGAALVWFWLVVDYIICYRYQNSPAKLTYYFPKWPLVCREISSCFRGRNNWHERKGALYLIIILALQNENSPLKQIQMLTHATTSTIDFVIKNLGSQFRQVNKVWCGNKH